MPMPHGAEPRMKNVWLVVLNSEPDTDHIVAAISKSLSRGQDIHFIVRGDLTRTMNSRLDVLRSCGDFTVTVSKMYKPRLGFLNRFLRVAHCKFLVSRWLQRNNVELVLLEWGTGIANPQRRSRVLRISHLFRDYSLQIQFAARHLGIPVVALPHGHALLSNSLEFTGQHAAEVARDHGGRLPFGDRESFAAYVVAHETDRRYLLERTKMRGTNIKVLGSARFSPDWISRLYSQISPSDLFSNESLTKVLFLLPKWNAWINREAVISLLLSLASLKEIELVVAEHPRRGASELTHAECQMIQDAGFAKFASPGTDSVAMIKACDCLVDISSSMVLDAVVLGKRVVMPRYLQSAVAETRIDESLLPVRTYDAVSTIKAICSGNNSPQLDAHFVSEILAQQSSGTLNNYDRLFQSLKRRQVTRGSHSHI